MIELDRGGSGGAEIPEHISALAMIQVPDFMVDSLGLNTRPSGTKTKS